MDNKVGNLQILVVEDEELIQELFRLELAKQGFTTLDARSVHEAMKYIYNKNIEIDLCLVDLRLPDGNGINLLSQIKSVRSEIPIIIMTGHGSQAILEAAMRSGSFDYIEKPFSIEKDVLPVIKRAISTIVLKKENTYLNDQILHSSKLAALGELSATVVHDIRGPLAMIQVTCEDLKEECEEKKSVDLITLEQHLGQIAKACSRIKKLVDHLRNYARNDKDELEEAKKLTSIIEDSLFLVEQKIRKNGIKTSTDIEEALKNSELICFPNKLEQVLMNLLSNACDAMQDAPKKELTVKAQTESGFLYISVTDTGTGIPDEVKSKIFESFFTTKKKGEGTGLGLSIVKNIVKEHGGDLTVISEFGKGSSFIIKLPTSKIVIPDVSFKVSSVA